MPALCFGGCRTEEERNVSVATGVPVHLLRARLSGTNMSLVDKV